MDTAIVAADGAPDGLDPSIATGPAGVARGSAYDDYGFGEEGWTGQARCRLTADTRPHSHGPRVCPPSPTLPRAQPEASGQSPGQACEAGAGKGLYSCSGWNSTAEVEWTQAEYEAHVFPLLHPHQKVFIVAGMFGCSNFSRKGGGLGAQSEVLVRKLRAHVEWARREPRESPIDVQATCACYLLERSYRLLIVAQGSLG